MASSSYPLSARLSHLLLILLGIVALSSAAALVTRGKSIRSSSKVSILTPSPYSTTRPHRPR
ncbi:hypothetical protein M501DRAFT_1002832 [Patellaria atrata CBS 101060]|uniref:Uncharacterized protein n=1 Tax=Patellaria atrata CBS 101060 TaxID=1346257 RepID=A0A9P4VT28_9PEZI|nr:hypothetical protein M501DRAFT_1002832 [Patellaria atrata CBS 101060]